STCTATLTRGVHPPRSPTSSKPPTRLHAVLLRLNSCRKILIVSSCSEKQVLDCRACLCQIVRALVSVFALDPSWAVIFWGVPSIHTAVLVWRGNGHLLVGLSRVRFPLADP